MVVKTIKATYEEMDKASEYMFMKLADPTEFGGAWFKTKKEAEDWGGDAIFDAISYYLEGLGITIEGDDEND